MTKQNTSASETGDRPALEIEVTPEMIEAGASVILAEAHWAYPRSEAEALAERVISDALGAIPRRSRDKS